MSEQLPDVIDPDAPIFTVSVAAALADMHPQTLRSYDRMGLVVPHRAKGGGRRYSPRDVTHLRLIQKLTQEEGINISGVKRIISLTNEVDQLRRRNAELAELLAALMDEGGRSRRVFTANSSGGVFQGRVRRRQLELPSK